MKMIKLVSILLCGFKSFIIQGDVVPKYQNFNNSCCQQGREEGGVGGGGGGGGLKPPSSYSHLLTEHA